MNSQDLTARLHHAISDEELTYTAVPIVDDLLVAECGLEAVSCIVDFIENHPDVDFGAPGPLVHFVEKFQGYEDILLRSIARRPTLHTVWMLNRVINGCVSRDERDKFVEAMRKIVECGEVEEEVCDQALSFLDFQKSRESGEHLEF